MLRKLVVGLAVSIGALGLVVGTASASIFMAPQSTLRTSLGSLPEWYVAGTYAGNATLTNNGVLHDLSDTASIWVTSGLQVGTAFLTGVNLLDEMTLTVTNNAGSFTASFSAPNSVGGNLTVSDPNKTPFSGTICPTGCLGGTETMNGQFVLQALGNALPFALTMAGIGGTGVLPLGTAAIVATGGPFVTGKIRMTGITTNVIQVSGTAGPRTGPGFVLGRTHSETVKTFTVGGGWLSTNPSNAIKTLATVTISGTNNLASASQSGTVTLVSPLRIQTGPLNVGTLPGIIRKKFVFGDVPEPGTMLLLVSGAAGLIFIGRKRMKS